MEDADEFLFLLNIVAVCNFFEQPGRTGSQHIAWYNHRGSLYIRSRVAL